MTEYTNPVPSLDAEEIDFVPTINEYTPIESVYFAFIDVLGFTQAFVDNRLRDNDEITDKFKRVFIYYSELMMTVDRLGKRIGAVSYAGQTSDSLYFYTNDPSHLVDFLKIFSHINVFAMSNDVFFRGGIANGNLYYKEKYQFYGDSVILAYSLEKQISKYPRIVIDEKTYKAIKTHPDCEKLVVNSKDRYYLLPFACFDNSFDLGLPKKELKEVKKEEACSVIEENITKFEYDAKTYEKYLFLRNESRNNEK